MTDFDLIVSRRAALGAAGAAGAAALLAACASGGTTRSPLAGGSTDTTGDPAGAGGSSPGTADSSGASHPGGHGQSAQRLAKLDSIPVGHCVAATLADGSPVIVARPGATKAACFSAICTHMGCTVAPAGTQLHCPCHGSVYNATTGQVIQGPAPRPLPRVAVTVEDGEVVTA